MDKVIVAAYNKKDARRCMELNMTLALQAMNFLCAYCIMRYGLFSHAVSAAKADKDYNDALLSAIEDRKVIIEQKLLEKSDHWKACQHQLAKNEPSPYTEQYTMVGTGLTIRTPTISDDVVELAIKHSVDEIRKMGGQP